MSGETTSLYLIGTPLGNLQDVTLRAVSTLKALSVLFAEDTREAAKLLEGLGIGVGGRTLLSYSNHNMKEATETAVGFLRQGKSVGFVSDRGMPTISDPGAYLSRRVREEGFAVIPIPGPTAPAVLLSVSGFSGDRFLFLGFLPDKPKERSRLLEGARLLGVPFCLFESPRRVRELVQELKGLFPGARLCVGREMTKKFETYTMEPLDTLDPTSLPEQGEFTLAVEPGEVEAAPEAWQEEARLRLLGEKDWAKALAARHGVSSKDIYNFLQTLKK